MVKNVSVIIPCYNSAWSLSKLAENLRQIELDDCEIIFVDDGSTDNSFAVFQSLFPTAICLRQENKGLGATRNRASVIAKGEFLQLLDADDTIEAKKLEAQTAYARMNKLDVVYSDWQMVVADEKAEVYKAFICAEEQEDIVEALLGGWWFPPNAALIRKDSFISIGGCDPTLANTCEDFDLWVRLGIANCKYGYLPGHFANYYRYRQVLSMSRKDPGEFFAGEEKIILKALKLLEDNGALTDRYRYAAAKRLHGVARNVYKLDKQWFHRLIREVYNLNPKFKPSGSSKYQLAARALGLKQVEMLASWKHIFSRA